MKPMLAHEFKKHKHKVKYPCIVQPKLDGIRCIATIKDGKCTLRTRTGNVINSVPHINMQLEREMKDDTVLDGELIHNSGEFDKTSSIVRKKSPRMDSDEHIEVNYMIFDMIKPEKTALDRISPLLGIRCIASPNIIPVITEIATYEGHIFGYLLHYEQQGFEGVMVRNIESLYEHKRSFGLLKLKSFQDEEFMVGDVIEGKGKLKGKAGAFVCSAVVEGVGICFRVKMACEESELEEYLVNAHKYIGKLLTVQFQGKTKRGIPRFPIGLRFREES